MPHVETPLTDLQGGIRTITLNRPDAYNAFNETMKRELLEALKEAEKDAETCCLVIRGAGEKAFSSGQDLKEHAGQKRSLKESLERSYNPIIRKIRSMEKPIIAMINGIAAGAGCRPFWRNVRPAFQDHNCISIVKLICFQDTVNH